MLDVNLVHNIMFSKLFLDKLLTRKRDKKLDCGLINVSSSTSYFPTPTNAIYGAAKHGLNYFVEAMAFENNY